MRPQTPAVKFRDENAERSRSVGFERDLAPDLRHSGHTSGPSRDRLND